MVQIKASKAFYIKLGRAGIWERESLKDGIIRFGYKETDINVALSGDWEAVHQFWFEARGDAGAATRDTRQIRNFFEAKKDDLWITFSGGYLWWCFSKGRAKNHPDEDGRYRETLNGWSNLDVNGQKLTVDRLSGKLLKMQGFRGTVCEVKEFEYLLKKLNGQVLPEIEAAAKAERDLINKIEPLIKLLTWQDFELLVDLVFSSSGWRRISPLGKTQKMIDLELILPTTGERAFVQIKSSTTTQEAKEYIERSQLTDAYSRMFFVWHTGKVDAESTDDVILIDQHKLAKMVFDAGLVSWLREKVS